MVRGFSNSRLIRACRLTFPTSLGARVRSNRISSRVSFGSLSFTGKTSSCRSDPFFPSKSGVDETKANRCRIEAVGVDLLRASLSQPIPDPACLSRSFRLPFGNAVFDLDRHQKLLRTHSWTAAMDSKNSSASPSGNNARSSAATSPRIGCDWKNTTGVCQGPQLGRRSALVRRVTGLARFIRLL